MSTYPGERTALIVVDAKNDFISEGGKVWPDLRAVCEEVGTVPNMKQVLAAARDASLHIAHAPMETHPWDYAPWKHRNPTHTSMFYEDQVFQAGTWGAEFHPDFIPADGEIIATPHKSFDAFHGTDLDTQLRQRDVDHVILCGLLTNTCIDSTGRDATERGYNVTFVSDAVGTISMDMHRSTIEQNWPRYAHHILTTAELLEALN